MIRLICSDLFIIFQITPWEVKNWITYICSEEWDIFSIVVVSWNKKKEEDGHKYYTAI